MAKRKGPEPGTGGRPIIPIDKKEFEKLCMLMCTEVEIADFFNCTIETLNEWCKKTYLLTFLESFKKKSSGGKRSLRRMQYESAQKGNVTMQIWLGKQQLGQTDKNEFSSDDKGFHVILTDYTTKEKK